MNRILILLLLLLPILVRGQYFIKPDYAAIKTAVYNKESAYYYPPLFERFKESDTTLAPDEYRYLYYGTFFYKKGGDNMPNSKDMKKLQTIRQKQSPTNEDHEDVLKIGKRMLAQDPFDVNMLHMMNLSSMALGDSASARKYQYRLRGIVGTIMSSGDGKTEETGFHVLEVPHEYIVLAVLGYEGTGEQSLTKNNCDYLKVAANRDNTEGVYFDVKQIFEGYHDMFKGSGKKLFK